MTFQQIVWRKVTVEVVRAIYQMSMENRTKKQIADALDVSVDIVKQVRNNRYACTDPAIKAEIERLFAAKDAQEGGETGGKPLSNATTHTNPASDPFNGSKWVYSQPQKKLAPAGSYPAEAVPSVPTSIDTEKEDTMLLQNHVLDVETLDHFGLERNPFVDDINTRADVFASPGTRRVRSAMLNAATGHGFIAIVGESGSGKSTLRKELEERIRIERLPIRIIKPYVVGVEPTDTNGKTMKSAAIADAIARTLAPSTMLKSSPDARFAQVQAMLTASASAGYSNLLVIEEAHRLPQATLRHLKGFMELEDGMRRMLGVCLIGQPELDDLLGAQNRDIREIVQRCNRVALGALGDDLEPYIQHKFERAGVKASQVLAPNVYQAIANKLMHKPRGGTQADVRSVCYPLMVNNLLSKAMNFAAAEKWQQVDAQVIAGC